MASYGEATTKSRGLFRLVQFGDAGWVYGPEFCGHLDFWMKDVIIQLYLGGSIHSAFFLIPTTGKTCQVPAIFMYFYLFEKVIYTYGTTLDQNLKCIQLK